MGYFVFADREDHIRLIEDLAKGSESAFVIVGGLELWPDVGRGALDGLLEWDDITAEALAKLDMDQHDRIIISARVPQRFAPLMEFLENMGEATTGLAML